MAPTLVARRWDRVRRLRALLLMAVAAMTAGLAVWAHETATLEPLEVETVDLRFEVRGERAPPPEVAVVAIDEATFGRLRRRWGDWPRTFHARAIRNLHAAGAQVIAYDVQFTEPSDRPAADLALYRAAEAAAPVVFATTETDARGRTNVLGGDENLRAIGARAAQALLPNDPGAVLRRVPYEVGGLESFAVAAVEAGTGRPLGPPPDGTRLWIDYAGPPGTLATIPFWRVYLGEFDAGLVRGRTVVVGPTAPSLQDVHATSVSSDRQMSGAEIQANAIATVAAGFPLRDASGGWNLLAIVLLSAVAPLAALRLAALRALAVAVAAAAAFLVAAQLAFQEAGRVLAVVAPLGAVALASVATLAVDHFTETRERRRLRELFARFVPEAVVAEVVERATSDLRLGGVRLQATVLFCDLRGFTAFAESLEAERVIEVLNRYLEEMSEAILGHGGTLVSYMGDGIMAVFGAPIELEGHAAAALAAAREMVGTRLPRFNAWLDDSGLPAGFRMGVGINTGPVMSGNVGSERRVEYTAVGDTTNIAARLEAMTKETGFQVLVSDATRRALDGAADALVPVGEAAIRGRGAAMAVWALRED